MLQRMFVKELRFIVGPYACASPTWICSNTLDAQSLSGMINFGLLWTTLQVTEKLFPYVTEHGMGGGRPIDVRKRFRSVIQAILLFGLEKWLVTPKNLTVLGGLQNRANHHLTGKTNL